MECAHCRTAEGEPLCESCGNDVLAALTAAPVLYVRAHGSLGARGQAMSERVSSSAPVSRSPLRDDLLELCDGLARLLAEWELHTFGAQAARVRTGFAVQRASVALGHDLDAALSVWRGTARAGQLVHRVRRLRQALGETPLVHQLAAPCPTCDTRALIRRDGADKVECRMCGNAWPEARYALLARALVGFPNHRTDPGA
jgi:ribosomal protein L37AE/L43A